MAADLLSKKWFCRTRSIQPYFCHSKCQALNTKLFDHRFDTTKFPNSANLSLSSRLVYHSDPEVDLFLSIPVEHEIRWQELTRIIFPQTCVHKRFRNKETLFYETVFLQTTQEWKNFFCRKKEEKQMAFSFPICAHFLPQSVTSSLKRWFSS